MKIIKSSGNVYADIGVAEPVAMLDKAQLAQRMRKAITEKKTGKPFAGS